MSLQRWLGMTGTLLGSFYVLALTGVMLHEAAHGLAAEAIGGRFVAFDINPGLGGWARWNGGVDANVWIVTWAGIAIDLAAGLVGLFLLVVCCGRHLTTPRLLLFLFALRGLSSSVGYTLQGFLFLKGDSGYFATSLSAPARVGAAIVLGALLLWILVWAFRRIVHYLDEHYEPRTHAARFFAVILTLFPWGVFAVLKPSARVFDPDDGRLYYSAIAAVLLGLTAWLTRSRPMASDPSQAKRPRALTGAIWLLIAAGSYVATATWLRDVRLVADA